MKRDIIRADGGVYELDTEVGDNFPAWNDAIGARMGELVVSPDGSLELWCDEEGLCKSEPQPNMAASMLVGRAIVGDVIVFYPGDVK